ncbi:MAG: YebC/PmpR family DNA-binding transcriptional regulator, partial [Bacteroidales bacterium]|nr:YebC/PmpR family DNA-binding transcriptional regulator [Bacteroidales bacterium]
EANPRLRLAVQNAKGVNMPKDNIERAINKANSEGGNLQELTFEGYTPYGIAVFIECLTDNNLRTISLIRSVFNKKGGTLGTNGSLSFIFDRKGVFTVPKSNLNQEEFELEVIDAGVEDIDEVEDKFILYCAKEDFGNVQKKLEEMNIEPENAELQRIANNSKELPIEDAMKVLKIIEEFEDLDDVQNVYHNLELTEDIMASLEEE